MLITIVGIAALWMLLTLRAALKRHKAKTMWTPELGEKYNIPAPPGAGRLWK